MLSLLLLYKGSSRRKCICSLQYHDGLNATYDLRNCYNTGFSVNSMTVCCASSLVLGNVPAATIISLLNGLAQPSKGDDKSRHFMLR